MIDEILKQTKEKMHKSVEAIHRELATVRTGKASTHLLDTVRVEAYGTVMPLNQVGTVSAPEARLLTIQAFDKTVVGEIVKAIQKAFDDLPVVPLYQPWYENAMQNNITGDRYWFHRQLDFRGLQST